MAVDHFDVSLAIDEFRKGQVVQCNTERVTQHKAAVFDLYE